VLSPRFQHCSVVQKSTFQTTISVQQNPEPSPDVAINAKPVSRYNTKTVPIITYVHSVSPPKTNRCNTFNYATVSIQTSNEIKQEVLLYSLLKRSLFEESEKCCTPIKLHTYTDDKKKIIINDMNHVSVPKSSEYAFQLTNKAACRYERVTVSI